MTTENIKITLPKFLHILSTTFPVARAMVVAKSIYKSLDTTEKVSQCTDSKLITLCVNSKEDRQNILKAIKNAGYSLPRDTVADSPNGLASQSSQKKPAAKGKSNIPEANGTPAKRKRKHEESENEASATFDYGENLDEAVLKSKVTVSNRAPVMTAWAAVVAEHIGFQREEALSIASVYTEMNAVSKGIALGHFDKGKSKDLEAALGGSQPFVELMGRRPLYRGPNESWRALSKGSPVVPSQAFSYISRTFKQTTPFVMGSMILLSRSIPAEELNHRAWELYIGFRPSANGWSEKSEMRCDNILSLRPPSVQPMPSPTEVLQNEGESNDGEERPSKKTRVLSLEEYELLLDEEEQSVEGEGNF